MRRVVPFLVFFTVVCGLLTAIHYYLWVRLVRDLGLPGPLESGLAVLFGVLLLSIPLTLVVGRSLPPSVGRVLLRPVYTWMGLMWVLLVAVGAVDLVKVLVSGAALVGGAAVEQRASVLSHSYPVLAVTLGLGAGLLALSHGFRLRVKRVEVPLEKLPRELDGTTIVQLSDVHVGPSIGRKFIERVVKTVNGLHPDVVVITGDLVDGSVERLKDAVAPLAELRAKFGSFFVTGNHEYYSGAPAWCRHLSSLGVRVLRNERVAIGEGAQFDLAGIDDHSAKGFGHGHGADLERALAGRDTARATVLLAHQPRAVGEAVEHDVDLQLSGHTHGGQIWPFHFLVRLQQPVVSGLERVGRTWLYVSNGTGYWGPPMRLAAPAEVTQLVLRAAPRAPSDLPMSEPAPQSARRG